MLPAPMLELVQSAVCSSLRRQMLTQHFRISYPNVGVQLPAPFRDLIPLFLTQPKDTDSYSGIQSQQNDALDPRDNYSNLNNTVM